MGKTSVFPIRGFGGISTLLETTHLGTKLQKAKNILLRPWGGFKGMPIYQRLWALGASQTIKTTITALRPPLAKCTTRAGTPTELNVYQNFLTAGEIVRVTTTGTFPTASISGSPHTFNTSTNYYVRNLVGNICALSLTPSSALISMTGGTGFLQLQPQRNLADADGTVALLLSKYGKSFLMFYNIQAGKARGGPFYCGDDASYTGTVEFTAAGATWEVLAVRLHTSARWYAQRFQSQLHLRNGKDIPAIVQISRTAIPGKWRLSGDNTRPAAPQVSVTPPTSSTNVSAKWTIPGGGGSGQRAGAASLTFEANSTNFPGSTANGRIYVRITYDPYGVGLRSTLTGLGTVASPYHYTVFTAPGSGGSSNNAIVSFVNNDSKSITILSASTSAANTTTDTGSWSITALTGGSGTGKSTGFSNRTVTVYARYFDTGKDGLGYEGLNSPISNAVIINALAANDIVVTVPTNPVAGGGRFSNIRIYLQFGEDETALYYLVEPDNPIANNGTTQTITIGSDTEFGQEMYVEQHQALPTMHCVQCNGQHWSGGYEDQPNRLYVSRPANETELAPEGANVDAYEVFQGHGASSNRISAMYSDNFRVAVHTAVGVSLIDPNNPDNQFQPPGIAGALNGAAITQWVGGDLYFLGMDLQLYQFNGTRYGRNDSNFAALDSAAYIMARADRDAVQNNPERVFMFPDPRGQMIWFFVPALDGTLKGFAYDFLAKGLVGEFDHPKIHGLTAMEPNRPEFIFADEALNLFVWDTANQGDFSDALPIVAAATSYAIPDTAPVGDAGYGQATWGGGAYRRAYIAELETGMVDLNDASQRKQFVALIWNTVVGSRGLVEMTITTAAGNTLTRTYGDIGTLGQGRAHKLLFSALDTAVKVNLRILCAEQKPFIVRDLSLEYRAGAGV